MSKVFNAPQPSEPESTVVQPEAAPAAPAPERKTYEQWVGIKNPPAWLGNSARLHHKWPRGKELTEREFETALQAAENEPFGRHGR